ncbi:MAG: efflux RND transporter permease subunit [Rikenellaceae bacterium]
MGSITEYSLRSSRLTWFLLLLFVVGGVYGFLNLGKKEDSTFVIKSASVICSYAGATPQEVEMLITEPIEREIQSMRRLYKITSDSQFGISKILVELDPATPAEEIPQLWDELRRKVLNIEPRLPAGASSVMVNDDFGDVYGIYYAITASDGFSFSELREWAQRIKTQVVSVDGVQKVTLYGEQSPVVNVDVSLSQLSNFSIRPEAIVSTIARQNGVVSSGEKQAGEMRIKILEQGSYRSIADIADQLLISSDGKQYRLGDIASVEMGYASPPTSLMRVNGRRAIGVGVSTEGDRDVVATGRKITQVLDMMVRSMPIGINLEVLYPEDRIAQEATNTFLLNLISSIAIVVVVIMLAMGVRAGVLIGSSLLFSIGSTLLIMLFVGEGLNRTSLAGFIIAMGMLVDNAIVVVDNAQNAIARGVARREAVIRGADAPKWSLLGATLIAIFSFLPLYLAPSAVAEIVKPLFVVLAISLLMSWVLALIQTPLFGLFLLSERRGDEVSEGGGAVFHRWFDRAIRWILRYKWGVVAVALLCLVGAGGVMERMPQDFFPSLDKPYFRADIILPEGYNIYSTERRMIEIERWLEQQPEVRNVSITVGGTPPRYYLASSSVALMPNFGNVLIELYDASQTAEVERRFSTYVRASFPDIWLRSSLFKLSPVPDASIEMGFIGEDTEVLTALTHQAEQIMWRNPRATNVRNSWGNRVPTWRPLYSQMRGGRIGVSRSDLAQGLTVATVGYALGEYREGDQFMPILMRDAQLSNYNLANMETLPIFSPSGRLFAAEQATSGFDLDYDLSIIRRFNRQRVMKAQCDPDRGVNTKELYTEILDSIQRSITLPEGYQFRVFGEEESQAESNEALAKNFPLTLVLIFITLLVLFGSYREPMVVLLMIPLIFIGVVFGLWATGKMFNFFALLGMLGLIGMNIKNGVVLVAQIGELRGRGVEPAEALISATHSRILPVSMASGTTILGMVPLLFDSLFGAMAATIMGGLVVATLLTFCVLPACYAIFYNIKVEKL